MAVDYFLKIEGIEGESPDAKHGKEIQVLSWSWGVTNTGTHGMGAGGGAGKAMVSDFNFAHEYDKASPNLFDKCVKGTHIKSAVLTARKAGGQQQEFLVIKFFDLLVSSVSPGASGEIPQESVSLNFTKYEIEYKPQKADGSLDAGVKAQYDIKQQK
ncbi:MAG TPA: type VI secretion system tube protein Hcp [Burkholderiaceae bacterium]|nr:type VI secretion system tube protein Hcp [Burkholderiaceae bacterium]